MITIRIRRKVVAVAVGFGLLCAGHWPLGTVQGQTHVTILSDTNGNLIAPTNLFSQNSALLEAAIPNFPVWAQAPNNYTNAFSFFGDSMVAGTGSVYFPWPNVVGMLASTNSVPVQLNNYGISGASIFTIATNYLTNLLNNPGLSNAPVLVEGGYNNYPWSPASAVTTNVAMIMTNHQANNIWLCEMLTGQYGIGTAAYSNALALNTALSNTYAPLGQWIPLREWLVQHYNTNSAADVASNALDVLPPSLISGYPHLNDAGYTLWGLKAFAGSVANQQLLTEGALRQDLAGPMVIGFKSPTNGFFTQLQYQNLQLQLQNPNTLISGLVVNYNASTYPTSLAGEWDYAPLAVRPNNNSWNMLLFNGDNGNNLDIQGSQLYGGGGVTVRLNPWGGKVTVSGQGSANSGWFFVNGTNAAYNLVVSNQLVFPNLGGSGAPAAIGNNTTPTGGVSGLSFYATNSGSSGLLTDIADLLGTTTGGNPPAGFALNYGIFSGNGSGLSNVTATSTLPGYALTNNETAATVIKNNLSSTSNLLAAGTNFGNYNYATNAVISPIDYFPATGSSDIFQVQTGAVDYAAEWGWGLYNVTTSSWPFNVANNGSAQFINQVTAGNFFSAPEIIATQGGNTAFVGSGGGLTNLNASQVTSGTLPVAQLPGAALTNGGTQSILATNSAVIGGVGLTNNLVMATNGFGSYASTGNTSPSISSGTTNANLYNETLIGLTGTSITYKALVGSISLGTITAPVQLTLQPGEAITGSSIAAAGVVGGH